PGGDQAQRRLLVHLRPLALRSPGREPLPVALLVDAADHAVDPAVAEGHLDRLGPGDRRLTRRLLPVDEPDLARRRVVLVEPGAEVGGVAGVELLGVHGLKDARTRTTKNPAGPVALSSTSPTDPIKACALQELLGRLRPT